MRKKNISKILTGGSAKQRALLFFDNIASMEFNHKPILTDKEGQALLDSFKTDKEIDTYNKYLSISEKVTYTILNLQGLLNKIKTHYSNLRGYILMWNAVENAELLANSVLHEIKDLEERKRIAQKASRGVHFVFTQVNQDEEGYIKTDIDFLRDTWTDERGVRHETKQRKTKDFSLWNLINNVKEDTTEALTQIISWEKAILDYMEETGFNAQSYKDAIKNITAQIYTPIIAWNKYETKERELISGYPQPRLDKLKDVYSITPDLDKLEVNTEMYNQLRKNVLGYE